MNDKTFTWPGFNADDAGHRTLQGWLVLDVQHQPDLVVELLAQIGRVRAGEVNPLGGSGNGYEFDFLDDGLLLACLYPGDELSPVTVPYPLLETALQAWLNHISGE